MRKKNGFTLVEIISVIGLLLVIATIVVPSVISINKRNKEKNYKKIVEVIKTGSENFIEKYRSDIPFNVTTGEYYFKLNVLGVLNLVKLPIKDPRTNENINAELCIKVTKNKDNTGIYDGTLSYEFPVACNISSPIPELTIDDGTKYVKKGSSVDLMSYVNDYKSTSTPKKYLKVKTDKNLNTNREATQEIRYYVIDLLNGNASEIKTKKFIVMDDQKINVVFLSDSVTKEELDNTDLGDWAENIESKFSNDLRYKDTGINFNVNVSRISTTSEGTIAYDIEYIGNFVVKVSNLVSTNYFGVFENMIVGDNGNKGDGFTQWTTFLMDMSTKKRYSVTGDCKYTTINDLYCTNSSTSNSGCDGYLGVKNHYYHYRFNGNEYVLIDSDSRCDKNGSTTLLETQYNNANNFSNTHSNPDGLSYKYTTSQIRNILRDKLGVSKVYISDYIVDPNSNIFIKGNKVGYLYFKKLSGTASGYSDAYILWEGLDSEKFEVNVNEYTGYNKTYLIITANNANDYSQIFNITNDSAPTYLFGDSKTLENINNNTITEITYTNMADVLNYLNDKIQ